MSIRSCGFKSRHHRFRNKHDRSIRGSTHGQVAELVDARHSECRVPRTCEFDSRLGYLQRLRRGKHNRHCGRAGAQRGLISLAPRVRLPCPRLLEACEENTTRAARPMERHLVCNQEIRVRLPGGPLVRIHACIDCRLTVVPTCHRRLIDQNARVVVTLNIDLSIPFGFNERK